MKYIDFKGMKILVFAPHADDEVIGCGGSILKWISFGSVIKIVLFSLPAQDNLRAVRIKEFKRVIKNIGVIRYENLNFCETKIKVSQSAVKKITQIILDFAPDLVLLPHSKENNQDHVAVNKIVNNSLTILKRSGKNPSYSAEYEVWSLISHPDYYEDITKYMKLKMKSLLLYKSQIKKRRYDLISLAISLYRGAYIGMNNNYGEAFLVKKYK